MTRKKKPLIAPRLLVYTAAAVSLLVIALLYNFKADGKREHKQEIDGSSKTGSDVLAKRSVIPASTAEKTITSAAEDAIDDVGKGSAKNRQTGTNQNKTVKEPPLTPSQQKARDMRALLDEGNERDALRLARQLMTDEDPDVRSETVTVVGWIGMRALPELTQMLADAEESIADEAMSSWNMAFNEIEDQGLKAEMLVMAMKTSEQDSRLEELAILSSQMREDYAVRAMVDVIESGNPIAAEIAREHYEFMTQDTYSSREAAEAWIRQNVEIDDDA